MRKPSRTSTASMALQSRWDKRLAQDDRRRITTIVAVVAVVQVVPVVVAADLAAAVARANRPSLSNKQNGPDNLSGPFCVSAGIGV